MSPNLGAETGDLSLLAAFILIAVIIDSQKGNQNFFKGMFGGRGDKHRLGNAPHNGKTNEHPLTNRPESAFLS
ncbi:MAG TPA: hypothetical protein VF020_15960 [Chthoniobacterales bacterium]